MERVFERVEREKAERSGNVRRVILCDDLLTDC